jgi:hypothetical protein
MVALSRNTGSVSSVGHGAFCGLREPHRHVCEWLPGVPITKVSWSIPNPTVIVNSTGDHPNP